MAGSFCYKDVVPFTAMVAIECSNVGVNVLFKAATQKGLSYYVFVVYSFAVSNLVFLLPLPFVFLRSSRLPPFKVSLIFKLFFLGVIGVVAQLCGYKGLQYTSPTLASALSNLIPAFTFILAAFFRMEKVALGSSSTQAKILGSAVSILGALIVVLYKGPTVLSALSPQLSPTIDSPMDSTAQTNWVLGGSLLVVEFLLVPIWYIVQANVMKEYPAEFIVVFLYNLCGTFISAPVCILLEENLSSWKINPDITLIAIIYSGLFCTGLSCLVHTWGIHLKGPVYISMFKPLSIAIAATLSAIFLGDALYFGTVVGALILSIGFYAVLWGKTKEELIEDFDIDGTQPPSSSKTPLLLSYNVKDNGEITHNDC
ncbi:WAT1-related protein At4g15540-like [Gastrolobium bilobum]|uniref:WAT1-related protein At4g15540-like n=1 Tax=Gastrolobium bilobum TaxID=150636 RepID=UPI002AAF42CD|nr:WAT1-related protein At4g15540-like [Gastrolobium bilobum]